MRLQKIRNLCHFGMLENDLLHSVGLWFNNTPIQMHDSYLYLHLNSLYSLFRS